MSTDEMNGHAMNHSAPVGDDPVAAMVDGVDEDAASLKQTLAQRQQNAIRRCAAASQAVGKRLLLGMTTGLELWGVPLPRDCDLDMTKLHTVSSTHARRIQHEGVGLQPHVWKHFGERDYHVLNKYICVLLLFHIWVQLAAHVSVTSLVALGDAVVMAESKRTGERPDAVLGGFVAFVRGLPAYRAKRRCLSALRHVRANVMSPQESECRMAFLCHGLTCPHTGYAVPGLAFRSGADMTLDMAWPEFKVAVEYDGDHHRTDRVQWRRDKEKRDRLRAHGWIVITATAANLASDQARAELAFEVARALALRGAKFDFHVVARDLDRL